jgi:D-glycero-alpha-D-manno-heptose-7-phosphate kinase
MIIVRSPLRITLGGGGTDLPSYYRARGGQLLAAAIDKYVYITLHRTFEDGLIIKYSKMERCARIDDVEHPIVREALRCVGLNELHFEIASMADVPAGTGLGSSGSFTTGLLRVLHQFQRNLVHASELAEQACRIELDILKEPIGKQDQYIAAFGGITCFHFQPDDRVDARALPLAEETLHRLEDNLLLFFTGYARSAGEILAEQDTRSRQSDESMLTNLDFIKQIGCESTQAIERGDLARFAELMNVHWEYKQQRSQRMSNSRINQWYHLARENGALGGKLIGAGGGGFLMFYAEDKAHLRQVLSAAGLREMRFRFDFEGTKVIAQS